jgi:hypothetical protein
MSAIRYAIFPFQAVASKPQLHSSAVVPGAATGTNPRSALPLIQSTPGIQVLGGAQSPRSLSYTGGSHSTPTRATVPGASFAPKRHTRTRSLGGNAALPGPSRLRQAHHARCGSTSTCLLGSVPTEAHQLLVGTSAASELSARTVPSMLSMLRNCAPAHVGVQGGSHTRTFSHGSSQTLGVDCAVSQDAATNGSKGGTVITAMQYVAIAMPQMQSQVDLIKDSSARQEWCKKTISALAQKAEAHAEAVSRLQNLQNTIRKVNPSCTAERHPHVEDARVFAQHQGSMCFEVSCMLSLIPYSS